MIGFLILYVAAGVAAGVGSFWFTAATVGGEEKPEAAQAPVAMIVGMLWPVFLIMAVSYFALRPVALAAHRAGIKAYERRQNADPRN